MSEHELVTWLRWQIDRDEEFARVAPKMAAKRREQLLAEVQAKRAILDLHDAVPEEEHCAEDGDRKPCQTVRLLAGMYAHCEGYRDEWRVQ